MKIVFLDANSIGSDIDLSDFSKLGEVVRYGYTDERDMPQRIMDADVIIVNKMEVNAETVGEAPKLKLVCVTATGTNNLDKEFLDARGIAWRNVAGYSTENVAQHTFALLFSLLEKMSYYDAYVKSGRLPIFQMCFMNCVEVPGALSVWEISDGVWQTLRKRLDVV